MLFLMIFDSYSSSIGLILMRNLSIREVKSLAQGHAARRAGI